MKILFGMLIGMSAIACPDFSGRYLCLKTDNYPEGSVTIGYQETEGQQNYTFSSDDHSVEFLISDQWQPAPEDGTSYQAQCEEERLMIRIAENVDLQNWSKVELFMRDGDLILGSTHMGEYTEQTCKVQP